MHKNVLVLILWQDIFLMSCSVRKVLQRIPFFYHNQPSGATKKRYKRKARPKPHLKGEGIRPKTKIKNNKNYLKT